MKKLLPTISLLALVSLISISCGLLPKDEKKTGTATSTVKTADDKKSNSGITARAASTKFTKVLIGKIGTYDVTMNLTRDQNQLSGEYTYEKNRPGLRGVLNSLSVAGEVKTDGSFFLNETEYKAKSEGESEKGTGKFAGTLTSGTVGNQGQLTLAGTWTKPNGDSPISFTLKEEVFDLGANAYIESKEFKEDNKKARLSFAALYPVITGATDAGATAINQAVEKWVKDQQAEWIKNSAADAAETGEEPPSGDPNQLDSYEITYEVSFVNADVVSYLMSEYYYSAGAAHPGGTVKGLNFDRKTGKLLALKDVFQPGSPYLNTLVKICTELSQQRDNEYSIYSTEADADAYQNWTVSRHGLLIHFEIAHVLGDTVDAYIPYPELKSVLHPSGPLAFAGS